MRRSRKKPSEIIKQDFDLDVITIPTAMFDMLMLARKNGRFYSDLCDYHRKKFDRIMIVGDKLYHALLKSDPSHPALKEWKKNKKPENG